MPDPSGAFAQTYDAYLATISPEDRPMVARYVEEVMAGKRDTYEIEHRIVWPDGSVHWIGCTARASRDDTGKLVRLGGTVLDITRRNSAENAVRESEELFRSAMALAPLGLSIARPDRPVPAGRPTRVRSARPGTARRRGPPPARWARCR